MNVSPAEGGTITAPEFEAPIADYPASFTCSDTYTLTAVPNAEEGYEFVDWVVNATIQTGNPITVSAAEEAKAVTAFFRIAGSTNNAPSADAGDDQAVNEGAFVIMNGSGSSDPNNDIRNYLWEQTSGTTITLSNPAAVNPTFTAPAVAATESPLTLTFQLTVEDVLGETDTDTVTITVSDSGNDPPVANAGSDQTVEEEDLVSLDGSGTLDPNGSDDIQSYTWQQLEGKEVTLSNALLVAPTFIAPEVEVAEDPVFLVFKLIVVDFAGLTSEDTVTIKVRRGPIGGSSAGCFISGAGQ